jgi:hypothetical protein
MWDAVKEAIQTNERTLRFIAIVAVLALTAWIPVAALRPPEGTSVNVGRYPAVADYLAG